MKFRHPFRQRTDWRKARPGEHILPQRCTTPDAPTASLEAFRSAPAIRREYERGLRNGWIGCSAFYTLGTVLLILAFHWLGVR